MENLNNKTIGQRLKYLRRLKMLSAEDVAEKLNLTAASVYAYEHDRAAPSLKNVEKLAEIYNVDKDYIIDGSSDENEIQGMDNQSNPWKDALVSQLKEENERLNRQLDFFQKLLSKQMDLGSLGKVKVFEIMPGLLKKGTYSETDIQLLAG